MCQSLSPLCLHTDHNRRYFKQHNEDRSLADAEFELAFPDETAQGYEAVLFKIRALREQRGQSRPRKKKRTGVAGGVA